MVSLGFKPNLPTKLQLVRTPAVVSQPGPQAETVGSAMHNARAELRGLSGLMQPKPGFRNVCRVMIAGIWTAVQGQDYVWTDAVQAWQ